jgi:hypothetical protein
MSASHQAARVEAAWRRANESPLRELISELLTLGFTEALDALAERLGVDRNTAALLVFEHGLSEPLPRCA